MNAQQNHALALLPNLAVDYIEKRQQRSRSLLVCNEEIPDGYYDFPVEKFCLGWAWDVGICFAASLDVMLQRFNRVIGKKIEEDGKTAPIIQSYFAWTQGSQFCFDVGHSFYTHDKKTMAQVQKANPAIPASYTQEAWPQEPDDLREKIEAIENSGKRALPFWDAQAPVDQRFKLRASSPRNPGAITLQIYNSGSALGTWVKSSILNITQDGLVEFLISGRTRYE